jgi:membrane-associated protease RseP (regulator of RpoE activity)
MDTYLILAIVVILIALGVPVWRGMKNVKWIGPLAMIRTHRGVHLIDRIAKVSPRFWKGFSTFGIALSFLLMFLVVQTLVLNARFIIKTPTAAPGAFMLIPGVTIPLWSGLIGIIILLVAHEFSHGIVARAENLRVKSVGALTLGLIPLGAFVEPDEKQVKKSKTMTQLRVFAAGSYMNILVAFLVLALAIFILIPSFTTPVEGLLIKTVEPGSPVEASGIEAGYIVTEMNGARIANVIDFMREINQMDMGPGDAVELVTDRGTYTMEAAAREDGSGFVGIQNACGTIPKGIFFAAPIALRSVDPACYPLNPGVNPAIFWTAFGALMWIIIINYGVGLFNLLPIKPLDGGLMVESLAKKFVPKFSSKVVLGVSLFTLFILLINIVGPHLWRLFS